MTVSLAGPATGGTLTGHDALYADAADMWTNGTPIPESAAAIGLPRISLLDGQLVKWVWPVSVRWDALAVRFGCCPEVATGGNVVFSFSYRYVALGSGSVRGAVTTISIAALSQGTTQYGWNYFLPSEIGNIPVVLGGFGDSPFMQCSLLRVSGSLVGGVSIGLVTATRMPS
jgi:hypothetical protein